MNDRQILLRHFLATLAYRTRKAVEGAPERFGSFEPGAGVRSPQVLLHHMGDLLAHTVAGFRSEPPPQESEATDLATEYARFDRLLQQLVTMFESAPIEHPGLAERLLQGPLSDAMTHAGQLALLRRLAGAPLPPENFFEAEIDAERLVARGPPRPE